MTDKLHDDVRRGLAAKRILDDEELKAAFDQLRADYLKAWESSQARDTDGRERLWQAIQIVGKVQTHLKTVVSNGSLARAELDRMKRD